MFYNFHEYTPLFLVQIKYFIDGYLEGDGENKMIFLNLYLKLNC